jgi:hypothetical protein
VIIYFTAIENENTVRGSSFTHRPKLIFLNMTSTYLADLISHWSSDEYS